ncbi:TetR family transcriptional regulator [Thermosporothrix hazakensis]|jgi:TetR/AcrR family tetracycline transcriptional repressor|uniref:TetR family transcriptional regulator n=1 Tax=Thermosporothrix hazakensis TaxID=644383 RepID=A0A326UC49_THEHA|nr:TetR/AcrR family transcriptional regulator C-terminal domain-containing protein [Thermosporothrix hazakensis]PZW26105.1 TetR family transcriptional regulator [Thermosporothrix hazakensis]GCE51365.1 putative transcriptional regulator, TetR family (tetracyclin resistance) [Thermosporothrix hazakensis]
MKICREQIITIALSLLDREGLEGVTLRKVAAQLHVHAGALYWHVQNKQELLDELANALLSPYFVQWEGRTPEQPWSKWLQATCEHLREAMLSHREGARVIAGAGLGRAVQLAQLMELIVQSLMSAGFSLRQAFLTCSTALSYVYGFVIEEQAAPTNASIKQARSSEETLISKIQHEKRIHHYTTEMDFRAGLELILEGAKQQLQK